MVISYMYLCGASRKCETNKSTPISNSTTFMKLKVGLILSVLAPGCKPDYLMLIMPATCGVEGDPLHLRSTKSPLAVYIVSTY